MYLLKNGDFLINTETGEDIGKQLLKRKANGYISYVRGENPYSFPYRIWPHIFDKAKSINNITYPKYQMNNKEILEPIKYISIYCNKIGSYQDIAYNYIIKTIKEIKSSKQN